MCAPAAAALCCVSAACCLVFLRIFAFIFVVTLLILPSQNLTSQFLSEDPATTVSHANPNRSIKYHFKGISPEQHAAILAERGMQLREKEEQKLREREQDQQWAALQSSVVRTLEEQEVAVARMRKDHNRSVATELGRQVVVHSEKEHFVNKVLHSNSVGHDFYKHFGASCR